jgi:type IV secretion system protein VirB10
MSAMKLPPGTTGTHVEDDPRAHLSQTELEAASFNALPQVARASSASDGLQLIAMVIGAIGLGGLTLFAFQQNRTPAPAPVQAPAPPVAPMPQPVPEPMPIIQPEPPVMITPPVQPPVPQPVASPEGSRAPALVIDNSDAPAPAKADAAKTPGGTSLLSSDEQFAAKFDANNTTKATSLAHPSFVVPQGAIIPAVLETALNSDLPGYVRAIVSRDVKSFDGTRVLIPRGTRLIGQYKSGLASGVTRAFVIWSRLIRPDGVSVQLASPATDEMGQSGLSGKVDNHFAKRFGAAALLSVVSGLASSSSSGTSNTIVIGTTSQAQSVANDALSSDAKIPPTIKVAQGKAIQVFVAADLDFSQ